MSAIWMRARAELRARRRQIISLALLLGLIGGVVIAAAGGARRTNSAYRDFLAEVNAPTLTLYVGDLPTFGLGYHIDVDELASYPEVEDAAFVDLAFVRTVFDNGVTFQPYEAALELGSVPLQERRIGRPVLVAGRIVVRQAVTLTLMAVVVGVPLGIAGGRWLWRGVADRIGFAAPVAGLGPAALIAAGTLLLAVVVALAPAQRAAHLRPGAVLRAE